ncbi:MAG: CoA-binding protein [Victivallales bacterium]|nr:CoA-binding protein [Victivallales bacterium]
MTTDNSMYHVVVLGASANPERYSNMAVKKLLEHGYSITPVNPSGIEIHGVASATSLKEISSPVHTLTVYVNGARSNEMRKDVIELKPKRVIFNPGAENPDLEEACAAAGIATENACTLVLLNSGQFNDLGAVRK